MGTFLGWREKRRRQARHQEHGGIRRKGGASVSKCPIREREEGTTRGREEEGGGRGGRRGQEATRDRDKRSTRQQQGKTKQQTDSKSKDKTEKANDFLTLLRSQCSRTPLSYPPFSNSRFFAHSPPQTRFPQNPKNTACRFWVFGLFAFGGDNWCLDVPVLVLYGSSTWHEENRIAVSS